MSDSFWCVMFTLMLLFGVCVGSVLVWGGDTGDMDTLVRYL